MLIFITAIIGVYYAKHEGLVTVKSAISQVMKNDNPAYEIISGATLAFAAILLIIPGFATDDLGFLIILPLTRKLIFSNLSKFLAVIIATMFSMIFNFICLKYYVYRK